MLNRAVWAWAAVWAMEVSRFKGEPSVCNQHPIICQLLLSHEGIPSLVCCASRPAHEPVYKELHGTHLGTVLGCEEVDLLLEQ